MKIGYNSAYVQIETLNFTFTWQAVIVHFYVCSNFQEIANSERQILMYVDYSLPIMSVCTAIASKNQYRRLHTPWAIKNVPLLFFR